MGFRKGWLVEATDEAQVAASDHLLSPVLAGVEMPVKRMIIVTDGPLAGAPLDVLPVTTVVAATSLINEADHLIDVVTVIYAGSAASWAASSTSDLPERGESCAILGFGLHACIDEARRVVGKTGGKTFDAVAGESGRSPIERLPTALALLYLPMRIRFDTEEPAQSALIMDAETEQAPILIESLSSKNVSTGLTLFAAIQNEELNQGRPFEAALTGSLLAAGSQAVMIPAWPIDDGTTARFLRLVDDELLGGRTPADALRRAKIEAFESGDPKLYSAAAAFRLFATHDAPLWNRMDLRPLWLVLPIVLTAVVLFVRRRRRREAPVLAS